MWFNSPEVSLLGQASNRIQYDQELCLLHHYSCGKIYKGETGRPLKVRLEEQSGMADHIWKEKEKTSALMG